MLHNYKDSSSSPKQVKNTFSSLLLLLPLFHGINLTTPLSRTLLRGARQRHGNKVLEGDLDDALLLVVALPERLREPLHLHASHDELIHGHLPLVLRVALAHQEAHKFGREAKAHLLEGLRQLGLVNVPGTVAVVGLERLQPLVDVRVQLVELGQVNSAALVLVEHADHQLARLVGEVLATPVDQGGLELLRVDLAAAIAVHLGEDLLHLGTHSGRHWRVATAETTARSSRGSVATTARGTVATTARSAVSTTSRGTIATTARSAVALERRFD